MVRVIEKLFLVEGDPIGVGGNSVAFGTVVLDEGGRVFFQQRARVSTAASIQSKMGGEEAVRHGFRQ